MAKSRRTSKVYSIPIARVDDFCNYFARRCNPGLVAAYYVLENNGGAAQRAVFSMPGLDKAHLAVAEALRTRPKPGKNFQMTEHPGAVDAADKAAEVAKQLGLRKRSQPVKPNRTEVGRELGN